MANNPSDKVTTESLNEVVIRLLGLNDGDELSYQTYFERIKKKLFTARLGGKELPREEDELLRNELKRVKRIKDQSLRFKVKKVKINNRTTTVPPSSPPSQQSQYRSKKSSSAIVKRKDAIVKSKGGQLIPYEDVKPKEEEEKKEQKGFTNIRRTLDSILTILSSKFKFEQKEADTQRKEEEEKRREKKESLLEGLKKGFGKVVSLTKKMLSPFDAIIERIKKFLFFTLLGRGFNMFMRWMENKENREKFDSLIEFLTKHWPAIAGLYILFGTSFGKLVRGLLKTAARMTVALVMNIGKIRAFAKKYKGLVGLGIGVAAFSSGRIAEALGENKETPETTAISDGDKDLQDARETLERTKDFNVPGSSPTPTQQPADTKVSALNLGGVIPKLEMPKFNLGGLIPQFAMGGINPFGGFNFQQGVPITGAGPDDTLIAAKTGEAVLTEKDQQDLSSRYVDRETGQPLNIPQYLSGRKSSFVNLNNLKIAGGYYKGGVVGGPTVKISKFNSGGVVGGSSMSPNINIGTEMSDRSGMSSRFNNEKQSITPKFNISNLQNSLGLNFGNIASSSGGGKGTLSKGRGQGLINSRSRYIFDRLIRGGLTPTAAAGIVANMGVETGYTYDPGTLQGGGGPGRGLVQWEKGGRYDTDNINLLSFAKSRGKPWNDLNTQIDFVLHELNTHPEYKIVKSKLNSARDASLATKIFLQDYEKAGTPHVEDRMRVLKEIISAGYLNPKQSQGNTKPISKPKGGNQFFENMLNFFGSITPRGGYQSGGLIEESTGKNIKGTTADRQLTALQPGEYVLPVDTVNRLGVPLIEKMVASTDSNSEAYLKRGKVNGPRITPYRNFNSGGVINLPPITAGSGMNRARASGLAGGSEVPSFSATAPHNERAKNASIYGLVG